MDSLNLNTWLGRWLSRRILYMGDRMFRLDAGGNLSDATETDVSAARVAVIGKAHYFETIKQFPFHKPGEIRSAVLLDQNTYSPFTTTRCLIRKLRQTDDGATVNLWFIANDAAGILEKQLVSLAIPETALLSLDSGRNPRMYAVSLDDRCLLSWVGPNGEVQSLQTDNDGADLDGFRRSIGHDAADCPVVRISGQEAYVEFLTSIVANLPLNALYPFVNFNPGTMSLDLRLLKRAGYVAAAAFSLYLLLSMSMPYFVVKRLEKEDKAITSRSAEWEKKQNEIEAAVNKQKQLAVPIASYPSKYELMTVLCKVMPQDAVITQMAVSDTRVEIRGQASSATDLLTVLSNTAGIHNAQFTSPVRKENKTGKDVFALSFEFIGNK